MLFHYIIFHFQCRFPYQEQASRKALCDEEPLGSCFTPIYNSYCNLTIYNSYCNLLSF